jgi:hypothetical protein
MWDKKRAVVNDVAIIDDIIIHHSAGSRLNGMVPEKVFELFNGVGFSRLYEKHGYDFATGYSEKYGQNYHKHDGKISYAGYHYCTYEYGPGEYVTISLIDDPMWTDAGSTGDRAVNARSIAHVFAGNFEDENIPESMVEYYIKMFRKAAPLSWILHKNKYIQIKGHRDVDNTACPGKYLYTYIPRMQREIAEIGRTI